MVSSTAARERRVTVMCQGAPAFVGPGTHLTRLTYRTDTTTFSQTGETTHPRAPAENSQKQSTRD